MLIAVSAMYMHPRCIRTELQLQTQRGHPSVVSLVNNSIRHHCLTERKSYLDAGEGNAYCSDADGIANGATGLLPACAPKQC